MTRVANTTIANGAALSGVIDTGDRAARMVILMPGGWTAAAMTFQGSSSEGEAFQNVYGDDGTEITIASANVVAGRAIAIITAAIANALAPFRYLKIRSGTSAAPVNQGAARDLRVVVEE